MRDLMRPRFWVLAILLWYFWPSVAFFFTGGKFTG
jgi:hypothetical protein